MHTVSDYERSILTMMAAGHSDVVIARRHNVSTRTLERHVAVLMARVGARSRLGLGAIAAHHGWVDTAALITLMQPATPTPA